MKTTALYFLLVIVGILAANAQPPQAFKYQAVIRDNAGNIIANQTVGVRISIHNGNAGGTIVYQETFTPTTNQFGLISLDVGTGTPTIGSFGDVNWRAYSKFLELECDPSGGTSYVSMGTSELNSVPYALFSQGSADSYWQSMVNNKICYNAGQVGIGTDDPQEFLEIDGANTGRGLRVSSGDNYPGLYGDFRHEQSGGLQINSQTASGSGGWADIHFQTNGSTKMFLESGGALGIGTTSPNTRLTVKSSGYTDGMHVLCDDDDRIFRVRQMSDGSGGIYVFDGADNATIQFLGQGSSFLTSGNLGINTTSPNAPLHVEDRIRVGEDPNYGNVYGELIHEGGGTGFKINAHAGGGGWGDMHLQTNGSTKMFIEAGGNVGIGTTSPTSRLDVQGNVTIRDISTGDIAIELGKGLDYAEGFDVSDAVNMEIQPGTVLCIDPANPGELKISDKAYDVAVAGIVAGANGLGSGVRLGTQDFDCDVALAGRVYCNTVAAEEDILPGDMLTTSDVPGYAMKASDRDKAQGAIIGKAMESLKKGETGQILVLVTLQ